VNRTVTLVGDGIENPANALTMIHAAGMFGAACRFRDTKGLTRVPTDVTRSSSILATTTASQLRALHPRLIACDNLPGAAEVYGFQAGRDFAVLVGNERRGLSHEFSTLATDRVHVPMVSRRINCLNVAAASAVALYYLCGTRVGPMTLKHDPGKRRPELLLLGAGDHVELGSAIRSAAAFGWERALLEDPDQVWFDCDRDIRAEGRAAARRARNGILLIPCPQNASHAFPRVTIITCRQGGIPIHRTNLARGASQLVVVPDESRIDSATELWSRFGNLVEFAHLQLPVAEFTYHYRLIASIALAEISRQVGRRPGVKPPPAPRPPFYDQKLARLAEAAGHWVGTEELLEY
jgi:tRNA G18 (ribose-2'-O)-methylase SpoU